MMREKESVPFKFPVKHRDLIHQVTFDYHGQRLALCSSDMVVSIWDRKTDGTWVNSAHWKVHGGAVWRVVWAHPEFGQVIATCSYDRTVQIMQEIQDYAEDENSSYKYPQWVRMGVLTDSRSSVTDIAFAPRHLGLQLATVSAQGVARIYEAAEMMDLSQWILVQELQVFYTRCGSVTWSHSRVHQPLLLVSSDEKKAKDDERIVIYEHNPKLKKWIRQTTLKFNLSCPVTDVRFSPVTQHEYHQIAIAAGDIHVYNIRVAARSFLGDDCDGDEGQSGTEGWPVPTNLANEYSASKISILGDSQGAWRIRFNVTGNLIIASSADGTVRFWKSMFLNQWALLTKLSPAEYMQQLESGKSW